MKCENCEKEHNGYYGSGRFCDTRCARSYSTKLKRKEINKKVSKTLKKNFVPWNKGNKTIKICEFCENEFTVKNKKVRFCSVKCYKDFCKLTKTAFEKYKQKCLFKFNVYNFPEDFDLDQIKKKGWYKASNRGNNLNGISRDHMFSIKEGFIHNIHSVMINHPANCELIEHRKNQKKSFKSKITHKELAIKIEVWDKKHNARVPKSG